MKTIDLAIIGTGSLAQATVNALSQIQRDPLRIAIIGRSPAKANRIAAITAATAVRLLLSLLREDLLHMSLPGVHGMRGGYPFVLNGRRFTLHLPPAITLAEAGAHNRKGERLDGLDLESEVKFVGKARRALSAVGFACAEGFNFNEWRDVRDKMVALRARLRRMSVK